MSALGNSVAGIVWPWIVLERTGDPAAAGLVAAAVAVPSVLFAFLGGYLIDTVGRKPMSVISDIISGLSVAGVVLVDQTLGLTIAWFIILGIVGGVGDIPGMAARSALVGDIAQSSGKTVDYIAGLNQAIMGVSFLVGPALAACAFGIDGIQLGAGYHRRVFLHRSVADHLLALVQARDDGSRKGSCGRSQCAEFKGAEELGPGHPPAVHHDARHPHLRRCRSGRPIFGRAHAGTLPKRRPAFLARPGLLLLRHRHDGLRRGHRRSRHLTPSPSLGGSHRR